MRVVSSKKVLFCGDCCDRNQAIILVVLVLVGLDSIYQNALVSVFDKRRNSSFKVVCEYICSVLDREVWVVKDILVEANLFLAIKLQPNLIIRAISYYKSPQF